MYGHLHANKLPHVDNRAIRNRVVNSIYVIISLCLLLYSTTAIFFLNSTTHVEDLEPDHYDVENMTIVSDVDCTFKVSGQYELAPKYTCFVLLAFTVIIRNHGWLAAGAAASVLTYSGVAAIHLIVFFAVSDRLDEPSSKSRCEEIKIPNTSTVFKACAGVSDPDWLGSLEIVSICLLGALPMAAWSTTFRKSSCKPIFIMWMFLLAMSNVFYSFTNPDPNRHYRICPTNSMEKTPSGQYQAPGLGPV